MPRALVAAADVPPERPTIPRFGPLTALFHHLDVAITQAIQASAAAPAGQAVPSFLEYTNQDFHQIIGYHVVNDELMIVVHALSNKHELQSRVDYPHQNVMRVIFDWRREDVRLLRGLLQADPVDLQDRPDM